ncbi:hypothetical protein FE810_07780 [Thalassotalea litorea]|uniref:Uncharacterized protein n=1 Tax=Thalassotalea litorea TaxID=2020715 RepID=A0A5R9IMX1_9GAMM|nr:hypothetical protein [Thalassotalea litorea]TLU65803.1 hypothetical protein FE810_07780 [Thalassotalea litorea]
MDSLKNLWQSQHSSFDASKLLSQAKKQQRRMFYLMMLDLLIWFALVIWACLIIDQQSRPDSLATGILIIMAASIATAYMLWLRTSTWGSGELDSANLLRLLIHRSKGAIQVVNVTYGFMALMPVMLVLLKWWYPTPVVDYWPVIIGYSIYCLAAIVIGQWYKKRQNNKLRNYQALLKEIQDDS